MMEAHDIALGLYQRGIQCTVGGSDPRQFCGLAKTWLGQEPNISSHLHRWRVVFYDKNEAILFKLAWG